MASRRVAHDKGLYLRKKDLEGFEQYAYHGVDTSPISIYVMKPFWNWIVNNLLPMWLSANLMTFVGWLLILSNVFLLWIYDPTFSACEAEIMEGIRIIPEWVWYWCALAQFLGHQLDGCDGTQARRTKTSTPIGELFDHGLDSSGCFLQLIAMMSSMGVCHSIDMDSMFSAMWALNISFYATHFEKYNTGVLFLPWLYDVSQLMVALMYLLTGVYGTQMWHQEFSLLGFPVTVAFVLMVATNLSGVTTVAWSAYRIIHSKTCKDEKCNLHTHPPPNWSLFEALLPAIPLVFTVVCSVVWKVYSPSNIYLANPRLFILLFGAVFSNITCRLIVSQMSSRPYNPLPILLAPLPFIVVIGVSGAVDELFLLRAATLVVAIAHIHYGVNVVRELCAYWQIRVFSLRPL